MFCVTGAVTGFSVLRACGGEESVGVLGARLLQEVPDVGAFGLAGVGGRGMWERHVCGMRRGCNQCGANRGRGGVSGPRAVRPQHGRVP